MEAGDARRSRAIEEAGRLDAAGRHQEAISILSTAAHQGDAAAKRIVGARIMLGDRAPALGAPGADLLAQAAADGDGEAAAILATLFAAGVFRPQNWERALDCLQHAAARGHVRSRGVLTVLAGEDPGLETGGPAGPERWAQLRAAVDPSWFVSAPDGRTLNAEPLIRSFPDFAPPGVCAWLIERSRGRLSRAQVYDAVSQQTQAHETRTNTAAAFGILETDLAQLAIQSRMALAADVPVAFLEAPAVLHYAEGEQITEHFDFVDPNTPDHDVQVARDGQRAITFLLYLNDDYEGGETEFPRIGVRHKGRTGEGMFFVNALPDGKADVRTVHAGRPPVRGEKWIVSQFIRNRPARPGASRADTPHPSPR